MATTPATNPDQQLQFNANCTTTPSPSTVLPAGLSAPQPAAFLHQQPPPLHFSTCTSVAVNSSSSAGGGWLLHSPRCSDQQLSVPPSPFTSPSPSTASTSTSSLFFGTQTSSLNSLSSFNSESEPRSVAGDHEPFPLVQKNSAAAKSRTEAAMGQTNQIEKAPKIANSRTRGRLRESDKQNFPCTIRLPDGEEKYMPGFKNFSLRTPDDERSMIDTVIHAPPNVTIDKSMCENLHFVGHRCMGDAPQSCPSPYGSHLPCTRDSSSGWTKKPSSTSSEPSKSGKMKEVFNSFVKSMLPSSRQGCRKQECDSKAKLRSSSCSDEAQNCQQQQKQPDTPTSTIGSKPVAMSSRSTALRQASAFPPTPTRLLGSSFPAAKPTSTSDRNAVHDFTGPPPTYEAVVKDKKDSFLRDRYGK